MAGHNKWSKIKRQKAASDSKRSKMWARITRDITVAAREGGGDSSMNPRLALVIEKAKGENMPKDNIERAIKRGTGEIEGQDYEELIYEGYAPGGVAVLIETLTDNTNRTVADLRSYFNKVGGSLGKTGSVAYLFDRKGLIQIPAEGYDEMTLFELVAEAGAEDLELDEDMFMVTTPPELFEAVQEALQTANVQVDDASIMRIPTTTVKLDLEQARKVQAFLDKVEEHQDVQAVFSSLDDSSVMELT